MIITPVPETRFLHDGELLTLSEIAARPKKQKEESKIMPHACCEHATVSDAACAYMYAYECKIHGPTRIGSSD